MKKTILKITIFLMACMSHHFAFAGKSIQLALQANQQLSDYTEAAKYPERKLVILTCMDARIDLEQKLGLKPGEAHVLRNAGSIVTDDVIRSILLSIHALGTNQVMVINHTDCGVKTLNDRQFRDTLIKQFGTDTVAPAQFYGFNNLSSNVKEQVQKIKSHPWIPKDTIIEGFIADVKTGKILKVD
jgi:carbonic anhydrase